MSKNTVPLMDAKSARAYAVYKAEMDKLKKERLIAKRAREKNFKTGEELARQGADRSLITDKDVLNGYDRETRVMAGLTRERKFEIKL